MDYRKQARLTVCGRRLIAQQVVEQGSLPIDERSRPGSIGRLRFVIGSLCPAW